MKVKIHPEEGKDGHKKRQRLRELTDQRIKDAHPGKEPEHRVFRSVTKQVPPRMRRRLHDLVGAVLLPAIVDLGPGQTSQRGNQLLQAGKRDGAAGHFDLPLSEVFHFRQRRSIAPN